MSVRALLDLLPGLYLFALLEGLAFGLRRGFDPLPRRVRLAFYAVLVALFGAVLFAGGVLLPLDNLRTAIPFRQLPAAIPPGHGLQGDLVHQIAPWLHLVRAAAADGGWPLWNPYAGAGMPLLADPQAQVLQPLVGATLPLPLWSAIGVLAALRVWTALAFTFLLLRRQGLAEPAACAGAFAYGCGGFLMLWLGWPTANVGALLPAALYASALCIDRGWRRDGALLALTVSALLLGGHPETILYALALTGLFLLDRIRRQAALRGRPEALRTLARCALALLLAGGLAAPVLLPAVDFLPTTTRAAIVNQRLNAPLPPPGVGDDPGATLAAWRERAAQRLAAIVAPRALGNLDFYWGQVNAIEDGSGYAGMVATLLALVALLPLRGRARAPQELLMAGVLAASLLLLAQPEGTDRLLGRLPGFRATLAHLNHRILLLVSFALAYLAACELDRWLRGDRKGGRIAGAALALAGAVGLAFALWPPARPLHLRFDFQEPALAAQLAVLFLAAALLLLPTRRLLPRCSAWGLAALAALELVATYRSANPAAPRRLAYPRVEAVRFLTEHAGNDRIAGVGASIFSPNFPSVFGLRDVRINNPSLPYAYESATAPIQRRSLTGVASFVRPIHPLYDLLGVRYVVARPGTPLRLPLVYRHSTAWIYERPGPLPRLFLPARAKAHLRGSWTDFLARNPDFAARALVEPEEVRERGRTPIWKARDPGASRLAMISERPTRIAARAILTERRLLASGIYQDRHWRILADGAPVPAVKTNGAFAGAWLPAGEWRIDLLYRPAPWVLGCLLCALALAFGAALWVPPPARVVSSGLDASPRA